MRREYLGNERFSLVGQFDCNISTVAHILFPHNQLAPFQIVNNQCYISAGFEYFSPDIPLTERA